MILSPADLNARLSSPRNSAKDKRLTKVRKHDGRTLDDLDRNDKPAGPALFIRDAHSGRRPGDGNGSTEPEVSIPATILARLGVSQGEISESFGISQSQVSNLKNGKAGNEEVQNAVDVALQSIRERVINKLDRSLDFVTDDKLLNAKASEVMSVASGLARIIESTAPKVKDSGSDNRVQIVIHGVQQVEAKHYEVIEVNG